MCVAATAAQAEPLAISRQRRASEFRLGEYGELTPNTEIIRLDTQRELADIVKQNGGTRGAKHDGFTVLKRDKTGTWSAKVYVLKGPNEEATLKHELRHAAGYVHD